MARIDEINAAFVSFVAIAVKQAMQLGAFTESAGQRQVKFVEHDVAAAMAAEHCEEHANGEAQMDMAEATSAATVAFIVAQHDKQAPPLMRTVGQHAPFSHDLAAELMFSHCATH